jgi:hypothetical protein
VIRQAAEADGVAFEQALKEAAGQRWGRRLWRAAVDGCPEISATWVQPLRRAVWWRACFRSPLRTVRAYFAFAIAELKLRFAPPVPWIAIFGSDRDKKSSVASEVVHRLTTCPYAKVKAIHWAWAPGPGGGYMGRAQRAQPVTHSHEGPRGGPIQSGSRLAVLAVDWLVNYWMRWVHLRAKGYILVFEDTYFHLVADPKRYRYAAGPRLARGLAWLLPKPDLAFLLDSEPDVPSQREEEGDFCAPPAAYVLNASLPVSALVDEIQRVVRASMLEQSTATLRWVRNPRTPKSAVTPEGATVHSTSLGGGEAEW